MKAFIFAAGMGSRLKPLTDHIPKALARIGEQTLLDITLQKMLKLGIRDITINVHHFGSQIITHIQQHYADHSIHISDENKQLLDTGGGLLHALPLLKGEEAILIHNVDIVSEIDINELVEQHLRHDALVSMSVSNRPSSRHLLVDQQQQLKGWRNNQTKEEILVHPGAANQVLSPFAFNGIHVVSPSLFQYITEKNSFSIIPLYLRLAKEHSMRVVVDNAFCMDAGTPENLKIIQKRFSSGKKSSHHL